MPSVSTILRSLTVLLFAMIISGSSAWGQAPPSSTPFAEGVQTSVVVSRPSRTKGGDWDDKMQKIVLTVKFANEDLRQSYEGYKATISLLGESPLDSKVKKVLLQESVRFRWNPARPRSTSAVSSPPAMTRPMPSLAIFMTAG